MLSVQDIQNIWQSILKFRRVGAVRTMRFEFPGLKFVGQNEVMDELRKPSFHTLIADESTGISVHKILFYLFIYFRTSGYSIIYINTDRILY